MAFRLEEHGDTVISHSFEEWEPCSLHGQFQQMIRHCHYSSGNPYEVPIVYCSLSGEAVSQTCSLTLLLKLEKNKF